MSGASELAQPRLISRGTRVYPRQTGTHASPPPGPPGGGGRVAAGGTWPPECPGLNVHRMRSSAGNTSRPRGNQHVSSQFRAPCSQATAQVRDLFCQWWFRTTYVSERDIRHCVCKATPHLLTVVRDALTPPPPETETPSQQHNRQFPPLKTNGGSTFGAR